MLTAKERSLLEALEKQAAEHGIEIVTVEVVGAKKSPTIRVYIDTPEGVSFDELSNAQAWINDIMDELDPFPGAYTLEVSSPGIDRPLRTLEHFERFAGETAVVTAVEPQNGRSKWTGTLAGVRGQVIVIDVDGAQEEIEIGNIKRARLKGAVDFGS
ncbi:ribosome maturation factor RimP [Raoultibacter massiliensis]|uniref:ribosome maturation factor RimP n=1 Tax=Raoultibacter massiliensis TaxID=1852371 RepID=UPI003A92EC21